MIKIRDVDTLEDLRVSLSMQLESAKKAVKSQDDLLQVKQLRIELNDVVDELVAAKNIAADEVKVTRLQEIRAMEQESNKYFTEYIELLETIVPALKVVDKLLPRANYLAVIMRSNLTSIESLKASYNSEYTENLEMHPHSVRGVPDYNLKYLLEWLGDDLNRENLKGADEPLAKGSKVMQSVIKKKAAEVNCEKMSTK